MKCFAQLIPSHEDLLRLEPEQLAGVLLEILIELDGGDRQFLSRSNFLNHPDLVRDYPPARGQEIKQAVLEAWMWLEQEGFLTPRIGDSYNVWSEISRRGKRAAGRNGVEAYRHASLLPQAHLHPKIIAAVYPLYLRGDYDTAVFQAFKEVEVAVRDLAHLGNGDYGSRMMRKAFDPQSGPLADANQELSERQALSDLFAGAMGYFKNPSSHRAINVTAAQAVEAIMLASQLLRIADSRGTLIGITALAEEQKL